MDKLDPKKDGKTPDVVSENIEKLRELFPEAFTEGSDEDGPRWKVDFEALKEIIGEYGEKEAERYSFTWHGKSRARLIAQTPSTGTLRPCPEESVNWDTTKNLFIEGDNLEVLKLLQKSYHKKVKMIYIDPPYNTGNDFIYPDKFADNLDTYLRYTGQIDDEGFKVSTNAETGGRYHTNWLNMMYPRLKLARNLLRDDGSIFVSIDDVEVANLRKLCDEVFGEENFVANVIWEKKYSPSNDAKWLSDNHDHILVYSRNKAIWRPNLLPRTQEQLSRYKNPDNDSRGAWKSSGLDVKTYSSEYDYEITVPSGRRVNPPAGSCWRVSAKRFREMVDDNRIWFGEDGNNVPAIKRFLSEVKDGVTPLTIWKYQDVGHNQTATQEVKSLFGTSAYFDTPKPTTLLQRILFLSTEDNDIVLDFFAGSGTTGEAVMRMNAENQVSRYFILVQLPEPIEQSARAYSAGFRTVADIGKARLKLSYERICGGNNEEPTAGFGFRTMQLDSSNIKPWDADFDNVEQALLDSVDNIKTDRSEEDVLYELLLKYGLDLAVPIETRTVSDKKVYVIGGGALIVCLAEGIDAKLAEGIVSIRDEIQPEVIRVVFKDSGFKDDVAKTNVMQVLKQAGIEDVKSL